MQRLGIGRRRRNALLRRWSTRSGWCERHAARALAPRRAAPGGAALPARRPAGRPALVAGLRALLRAAARRGAHGAARLHRTAEQRHRPQRRHQVTVSMRQTDCTCSCWCPTTAAACSSAWPSLPHHRPDLAMLELSKGKLTSQPERHTGRGLFFTVAGWPTCSTCTPTQRLPAPRLGPPQLAQAAACRARAPRSTWPLRSTPPRTLDERAARAQPGRRRLRLRPHRGAAAAADQGRAPGWSRAPRRARGGAAERVSPCRARLQRHRRRGPRLCRRTVPRLRRSTRVDWCRWACRRGWRRWSSSVPAAAGAAPDTRQSTRQTLSMLVPPG
jgi:hypothetical protein